VAAVLVAIENGMQVFCLLVLVIYLFVVVVVVYE